MIMFREDDLRLKRPPGFIRKWLTRILVVLIGGFIGLSLVTMTLRNLGGPREALKKGLEEYITESTGFAATVGSFNDMQFYPDFMVDASGISLAGKDGEVGHIDKLVFSRPFFDQIFSRNRFEKLQILGVHANAGLVTDRAFDIKRLELDPKGANGSPGLVAEGSYGKDAAKFSVQMGMTDAANGRHYFLLNNQRKFQLDLGKLHAEGMMEKAGGGLHIDLKRLTSGGHDFSGDLRVGYRHGGKQFQGTIKTGNSSVEPALSLVKGNLTGKLDSAQLDITDFDQITQLIGIVTGYLPASGQPDNTRIDLGKSNMDVTINAHKLTRNGKMLGHFTAPAKIEKQVLTLGPVDGEFSGGKMTGDIKLDTTPNPAQLTVKMAVTDMDYGQLQNALYGRTQVTGTAAIHASLKSAANRSADLFRGLGGEIVLVSGHGKMTVPALDVWNTGLFGVMLPSLGKDKETVLNCFIADFTVKNGVATTTPLFLDTDMMTIVGDGAIDLPKQTIDMKLTPNAKSATMFNFSTSVRVKGPLDNPHVAPDRFDTLKKLLTLAPSAINPAFAVFGLSDLGISAEHSCAKFIAPAKQK